MTTRLLLLILLAARAAAAVQCLDGEEAAAALLDESLEPYFAVLEPAEIAAKTGAPVAQGDVAAARAACRDRFRAGIRSWTADERAALTRIVDGLAPALAPYPLVAEEPWRFLKVATTIEGGLPHTRGRCIVLSELVLPMLVAAAAPAETPADATAAVSTSKAAVGAYGLLAHERLHVIQRLHPEVFARLYTDEWHFVRAAPAPVPDRLRARQVVNPDGVDTGWLWPVADGATTRWIQPFLTLRTIDGVPRMPADFEDVALAVERIGDAWSYRLDAAGEPVLRPLAEEAAYAEAFAATGNRYHPNETSASLFARIVVHDAFTPDPPPEPAIVVALRTWCRANLGAPSAPEPAPPRSE